MNFCMKKVLIIWISGNKMESFSTQDVSRDLPLVFTKLVWYFKNQDIWSFSSQMVRWYFWYHGIPYLLITEKSLFWTFRWWKYGLFWAKKLMERLYHFKPKSWWKDDAYWLWINSCFEPFGGGKYGLCYPKRLWRDDIHWAGSFWAFLNILGFGKNGSSCSV